MAVNLSKNGNELMAAYKDVLDGKSGTNWALFTYEGNSNDIRLAEKGDGGLEEMVEEFNSGKVMYAFCRVEDPNSGLPKYVLINWTGEGVNSSRKGICANHVLSMANFLKGAHVTINARDDDDVEPNVILDKVAKASGASFNFHKHKETGYVDVPRGPVGSVYRKVNAVEEIQHINKDDFWVKAQKDEEIRKREEIKRAEQEQQQLERERKEMEERQSRERERRAKERAQQIEQEKIHQKQREQEEREQEQQRENLETKAEKKTGISHAASVQKANEAKSLISQRSFNPRDIFKQREQSFDGNNSNSPSASRPGKLQSPFLYQKNTGVPEQSRYNAFPAPLISVNPEPAPSPSPQSPLSPMSHVRPPSPERDYSPTQGISPIPPLVTQSPDAAENEEGEWSDEFDDEVEESSPDRHDLYKESVKAGTEQDLYENIQYTSQADENHVAASGQGITARAIYDYQAADDTEITFDPDDIITGIDMIDDGWWRGFGPDGHYGMFPSNYVELQ
ncbi:drebrin-like a [Boleophthalmus pectinirostris]|uniref:drebrin-like a n=1 Tax=Boleophthalmus pectinirostris TaxID=150288 RepID=UPI0024309554|nr:drebrin-like a [Boleophthalmus pectinirostris]